MVFQCDLVALEILHSKVWSLDLPIELNNPKGIHVMGIAIGSVLKNKKAQKEKKQNHREYAETSSKVFHHILLQIDDGGIPLSIGFHINSSSITGEYKLNLNKMKYFCGFWRFKNGIGKDGKVWFHNIGS